MTDEEKRPWLNRANAPSYPLTPTPVPAPAPQFQAKANPPLPILRTPTLFNCANASLAVDYVICASPQLMDAEARLEDAFAAARAIRGDVVRQEQREWNKRYGPNCGLPYRGYPDDQTRRAAADCVGRAIERRITELKAMN